MIYRLQNRTQPYAWGSHHFIAQLCGKAAPSSEPEAEMWMGAHPSAPSEVIGDDRPASLLELLTADPQGLLGEPVARRFGTLPFLLKVLAAEQPLSLQAHPTLAQAREGFAKEERLSVSRSAPTRNYKDDNHKPELVVALTPFSALCGFRPLSSTRPLIAELDLPVITEALTPRANETSEQTLQRAFTRWLSAPAGENAPLVSAIAHRASELVHGNSAFAAELGWLARLAALHPGDAGCVCALLLNLIELSPGQALYLPAGNLHAYLRGAAIEIMANSDNVLRGGLTSKHVDVAELLRVLDFSEAAVRPLEPRARGPSEVFYATPAEEFELSSFELTGELAVQPSRGPEILLVTRGEVSLRAGEHALTLPRGQSAFLPARVAAYSLCGDATVFRASVPP